MNHCLLPSLPTLATMALVALVGAGIATPAYADREPTSEERARIMEVLRAAGYDSPEEIELDDDGWEVDDAKGSDGREYDLELDPDSLEIISRDD
jgi:Peptidase propeptide and YPEB domain